MNTFYQEDDDFRQRQVVSWIALASTVAGACLFFFLFLSRLNSVVSSEPKVTRAQPTEETTAVIATATPQVVLYTHLNPAYTFTYPLGWQIEEQVSEQSVKISSTAGAQSCIVRHIQQEKGKTVHDYLATNLPVDVQGLPTEVKTTAKRLEAVVFHDTRSDPIITYAWVYILSDVYALSCTAPVREQEVLEENFSAWLDSFAPIMAKDNSNVATPNPQKTSVPVGSGTPASHWTTYQENMYPVQFSYPDAWKALSIPTVSANQQGERLIARYGVVDSQLFLDYFTTTTVPVTDTSSLLLAVRKRYSDNPMHYTLIASRVFAEDGGTEGAMIEYRDNLTSLYTLERWIIVKGTAYALRVASHAQDFPQYKDMMQQVVGSFVGTG